LDPIAQRHSPEPTVSDPFLLGGRDPDCLVRGTDASFAGQQRSPSRCDLTPDSARDLG
jgi:hypothetical protein